MISMSRTYICKCLETYIWMCDDELSIWMSNGAMSVCAFLRSCEL